MPLRFSKPAATAYTPPLTLKLLLAGHDQHRGQEIVSEGVTLSYAESGSRVRRLASALRALGVGHGTVVAVLDWDSHRYLECYFAIPLLGAVLQTVNVRLSPAQIRFTLHQTGAEVLIVHPDFAGLVAGIAGELPQLRHVIPIDGAGDRSMDGRGASYEALVDAAGEIASFADFDENAIATTFHTTGTTGDPKAVEFSHRQLVLHTLAVATALGAQPVGERFGRDDVYMPLTPMFHVHAWGLPYVATMLGAKQVYPGRYRPAAIVALQRRHGVTFSHCVPTILRMILDQLGSGRVEGRWTMVIGGSALAEPLCAEAAAKGIHAVAGYGMSETGPVTALARSAPMAREGARCRAGFPIPLVAARIASPAGGEMGELQLRAPWLTRSYPGADAASEQLWEGGWLHTQDLAVRDDDGAIRIVDRLKDVIKTGGEWVSAGELEALTLTHPAVAEVAYVGIADERWGERPVAAIVTTPGVAPITLEQLREQLLSAVAAGRISRYALPDRLHILDALPRTSVGKIDKRRLRTALTDATL